MVTSTKVITSTLPPITIVSTVIGTSTQIHTLNTATPTRVKPFATASTATTAARKPFVPPVTQRPTRRPESELEREQKQERERDRISIAGILVPDSIDLGGAQQGISDDNEVNRVIINPGAGQHLVVEQAEAVATRCQRPCLEAIFETCRPVGGVYRCACRPGFARAREEDPCERESFSTMRYLSVSYEPYDLNAYLYLMVYSLSRTEFKCWLSIYLCDEAHEESRPKLTAAGALLQRL